MRSLRRFLTRLANVAAKRRHDERLKEEIEEHLALQAAENLRSGLPSAEARRQAMLKFGAVEAIKEEYRAERRMLFIDTLPRDVRHALRMLREESRIYDGRRADPGPRDRRGHRDFQRD